MSKNRDMLLILYEIQWDVLLYSILFLTSSIICKLLNKLPKRLGFVKLSKDIRNWISKAVTYLNKQVSKYLHQNHSERYKISPGNSVGSTFKYTTIIIKG